MTLCSNCKDRPVYALGLCRRCYRWQYDHGEPRPAVIDPITQDDMVEIALSYMYHGVTLLDLAKQYGVGPRMLHNALRGNTVYLAPFRERIDAEYLDAYLTYRKTGRGVRKFTPAQARNIRREYAGSKVSFADLARKYRVTPKTISDIVYGHKYRECGGPIVKSYSDIQVVD